MEKGHHNQNKKSEALMWSKPLILHLPQVTWDPTPSRSSLGSCFGWTTVSGISSCGVTACSSTSLPSFFSASQKQKEASAPKPAPAQPQPSPSPIHDILPYPSHLLAGAWVAGVPCKSKIDPAAPAKTEEEGICTEGKGSLRSGLF